MTISLRDYINTRHSSTCCPSDPDKDKNCCVVEHRRQRTIEYACYNLWLPNVRVVNPTVPDNILLDYIREAAIEFASRTHILTRDVTIKTQKCVADYWPCLGQDEIIRRVKMVSVDGECYDAVGNTCSWELESGTFWFYPPNSLEVPGDLKEGTEVRLTVSAIPSQTSSYVDKIIYDNYFTAITDYAAAKAQLVPISKDDIDEYGSTHSSVYQLRMDNFNRAVKRAKTDVSKNFSNVKQTWNFGQGGCCG